MARNNFSDSLTRLDVPVATILKIALVLLAFYGIYIIRDLVVLFFVSLIFASAFDGPVDWLQRYRIPRGLSIVAIYLSVITILVLTVSFLIPSLLSQYDALALRLSAVWEQLRVSYDYIISALDRTGLTDNVTNLLLPLQTELGQASSGVLGLFTGIIGGIASLVLVLVTTFYLTIEESAVKRVGRSVLPDQFQPMFTHIINQIQSNLGLWLRGQIILGAVIGVLSYIGLRILDVEFALPLAVFAGLMEWVPYFGPVLSAIPAIIVALSVSPFKALLVLLLFWIIQFLENNLIVPKIMQRAVGLHPLVVIFSLLIGYKMAGVIGILLAVPVATVIRVIVQEVYRRPVTTPVS